MNYPLVLSALRKHARIAQKAADFFREHRKGQAFAEAQYILDEAVRALQHVEEEHARLLRGKNQKPSNPKISKGSV